MIVGVLDIIVAPTTALYFYYHWHGLKLYVDLLLPFTKNDILRKNCYFDYIPYA